MALVYKESSSSDVAGSSCLGGPFEFKVGLPLGSSTPSSRGKGFRVQV